MNIQNKYLKRIKDRAKKTRKSSWKKTFIINGDKSINDVIEFQAESKKRL